jgi:hypothetical protein
VVGAADAAAVADDLPEESWVVGEVVAGKRQVALV